MSNDDTQIRKIRLTADNQSVYRFKLFFNEEQEVPFKYECKKRKGEIMDRLEYAVYLSNGLWGALEKRVCSLVSIKDILPSSEHHELFIDDKTVKSKPIDYESIKRLIMEYYLTSCALLGFILTSGQVFPKSRVVYFDSEKNLIKHSGFIESAEELR